MQKYKTVKLSINGKAYCALMADTAIKRMIGLMFRKSLDKDTCMLFVFPYAGTHGIWMRNMLFSIDIVWLNGESKIIDMVENAKPCESANPCNTYFPSEKAKYVMEFISGTIKRVGLTRKSILDLGIKA